MTRAAPLESKPVVHIGENKEGCRNTSENTEREAESEGSRCEFGQLLHVLLIDANKNSISEKEVLPVHKTFLTVRPFTRVD